jgi:drug/metabolite transporter (DMT)-like permease
LGPLILTILLPITSVTCLNMVIRLSVGRTSTRWGVIAANYATASAISFILVMREGGFNASSFTILLGIVTGSLYTGGLFLSMTTMGRRGASIAASITQLSVIVPVTASVFVFEEKLGGLQLLGVITAVASLPLLSYRKTNENEPTEKGLIPLFIAMLMVQGFAQLSSKTLVATGLEPERNMFFLTVFTSAMILTIPLAVKAKNNIVLPRDAGYGLGVGTFNMLTNMSILLALNSVPASLFFPLNGSAGLVLTTLMAMMLFRERINKMNTLGILLTVSAMILINI